MLQIEAKVCEGCDEFDFIDTTGLYDAVTNPDGYGPENGITEPSDFDSYTLEVWFPGVDTTGPASYTYDLLTPPVPTIDADDHYTWTITKGMMGLTVIKSGVWTMKATAVAGEATYIADVECIFVNDVSSKVDAKMLDWDPMCPCKKGCENPAELFVQLQTIKCGGICDAEKAQSAITNLYSRVKNCC
jgi:hypothetical protein